MANYHFEVKNICRGNGGSVTNAVSYACGKKLHDIYRNTEYVHKRNDVLYCQIYLPANAPLEFANLQTFCNEIEKNEKRYDARTARTFICSLPNELPIDDVIKILNEFILDNFTSKGLCAVAAIHEGKNVQNPLRNNPHAHIIVTTRTLGKDGFNSKKDREHNKKHYVKIWREEWAKAQNRAYERNGMDIRVSHESLEIQGKVDREPTIHISQRDWQKEQRGERTIEGNKKRAIKKRNEEKALSRQKEQEHPWEHELSR